MLYEYIINNYTIKEPIFLSDLETVFGKNAKQYVYNLVKDGRLKKYINGVYYIPFKTILGTEGTLNINKYVSQKYISDKNGNIFGYIIGGQLANSYGITSQNYQTYEIRSNIATTEMRKLNIKDRNVIIKKPFVEINKTNWKILQFLDLIYEFDTYSELSVPEMIDIIKVQNIYRSIDINDIKKYIDYYPSKIYKQLYKGDFYELLERR